MNTPARTTETLQRQLRANRNAAKLKYPQGHAHLMPYRPAFVRDILEIRAELRRRGERTY